MIGVMSKFTDAFRVLFGKAEAVARADLDLIEVRIAAFRLEAEERVRATVSAVEAEAARQLPEVGVQAEEVRKAVIDAVAAILQAARNAANPRKGEKP